MAVLAALLKYRFHLLVAVALSLTLLGLVLLAPRFLNLVAYFWPLLLSTALFLVAVVFFGKTSSSPPPDKAGEDLLDYVAGEADPVAADPTRILNPNEQGQHQQDASTDN